MKEQNKNLQKALEIIKKELNVTTDIKLKQPKRSFNIKDLKKAVKTKKAIKAPKTTKNQGKPKMIKSIRLIVELSEYMMENENFGANDTTVREKVLQIINSALYANRKAVTVPGSIVEWNLYEKKNAAIVAKELKKQCNYIVHIIKKRSEETRKIIRKRVNQYI